MTAIKLPRAVVQQVRDALAVSTTPLARDRQTVLKAIAALDEALAQPAPPSEERAIWCGHCGEGTIPGLCRGKVPFTGCPAQPAPTPELPPLPDERAAFEDLLDAAEEWERFVDVDRAPMNLRKWLERAALAQRSA